MWLQSVLFIYSIFTYCTLASLINAEKLQSRKSDVCETPGCIKTAAEFLENMDSTIDPCEDFYKFSCGNYDKNDTYLIINNYAKRNMDISNNLKEIFQGQLDGSEPAFVKLIRNAYDSCVNTEKLEEFKSEPLKKLLKSLDGWPVVEGKDWDASKFDWLESVLKARNIGAGYNQLMNVAIKLDTKNNKRLIIQIDAPELGMPNRDYFLRGLNDGPIRAYYRAMENSALKLGANPKSVKELLNALKIEIGLAKIITPMEEQRDENALHNVYTVKGLQELAPQIDWLKLLNGILVDPVTEEEEVVVTSPKFLKNLGEYIAAADKRALANYIIWRTVKDNMSFLSKEWTDLYNEYQLEIDGAVATDTVEICIEYIKSTFSIAVSAYYVKNYFDPETRDKATEVLNYVRNELYKILENAEWMDEETGKKALDKAKSMSFYVGHSEELLNETFISDHYKNLSISRDDYFNNNLKIKKWESDKQFAALREPLAKNVWQEHTDVATANAFYSPSENLIDIPAGILGMPFFSKDRPRYLNFAGIGETMGHEITHGFDDMGRQYDIEGNNKNWWSNSTDKQFLEKTKCIIDQYSAYTAENGMKLNGIITQGENIADNGGLKEAYRAYQAWVKDNGPEPRLPGLNYTTNQLFWITVANGYCSKTTPEMLKQNILSDNHSPFPFRVIGSVSNLVEFSNDFNCPVGSPMNPQKKCKVW